MAEFAFEVVGLPAPQGSKSVFKNRKTGQILVTESSKKVKPWREAVKKAAELAARGFTIDGPVSVRITFMLPRPKSHFGTGRNAGKLKKSAPESHTVMPDLDKLVRSTLDALTSAGVWKDDAQVMSITTRKIYGDKSGAVISVSGKAGR